MHCGAGQRAIGQQGQSGRVNRSKVYNWRIDLLVLSREQKSQEISIYKLPVNGKEARIKLFLIGEKN